MYNFNLFRFKKSTENGIPFFLLLVQKLSVVKKTGLYLQFSKKEKAHGVCFRCASDVLAKLITELIS